MTRTITVEQTVSMGHRLPSYQGICSSPHGHNVRFVVDLEASTFVDFKDAGVVLWDVVKYFDHAMVLDTKDPLYDVLFSMDFRVFAFPGEPTTEAIAEYVLNQYSARALRRWPFVTVRKVTVHETEKYSARATQ